MLQMKYEVCLTCLHTGPLVTSQWASGKWLIHQDLTSISELSPVDPQFDAIIERWWKHSSVGLNCRKWDLKGSILPQLQPFRDLPCFLFTMVWPSLNSLPSGTIRWTSSVTPSHRYNVLFSPQTQRQRAKHPWMESSRTTIKISHSFTLF